jgi:hypothetical protein
MKNFEKNTFIASKQRKRENVSLIYIYFLFLNQLQKS